MSSDKITFYYMHESPPCRAVQLTAAFLKIPLELKYLDLSKGDQFSPDFLKVNPTHTIPVIVDGTFVLSESRAIMCYLVNRYDPESKLYPRDPLKRAKIDQMLYYDLGTLYKRMGDYLMPILESKPVDGGKEAPFREALSYLDSVLSTETYVSGTHLSLADISIICSLSFSEAAEYDLTPYQKLTGWMARVKSELPEFEEINGEAMKRFTQYLQFKKSQTQIQK